MTGKEAARRSSSCKRAFPGSGRTRSIVSDWEQGTLAAGLMIAIAFGLMFLWAAVML